MLGGPNFYSEFSNLLFQTYKFESINTDKLIDTIEKALAKKSEKTTFKPVRDIIINHFEVPGVDFLKFDVDYAKHEILITQTCPNEGLFRQHYFDIALYDKDLKLVRIVTCRLPPVEQYSLMIEDCPDFVNI